MKMHRYNGPKGGLEFNAGFLGLKHWWVFAFMLLIGQSLLAQEVNVSNAVINVPAGVFMTTDGGVVIQNSGAMDNGGTVEIKGNWTNDGNGLINNSAGTVVLAGANETIGGSNPTTFNNLTLTGSGVKTLAVNATVTSTLALNDRELFTGVNTVFVTNPSTGAVTWSTGFISSAPGGSLSRVMAASSTYVYPVGAVGKFRPVEITPSVATSQTYAVRMANVDANTEGFPRSTNDGTMTSINGSYYHQINRTSGTSPSDVAIYFDSGVDGGFNTLTHWQGAPRWENMTPVTAVTNFGLSGFRKSGWNNFSPFALANSDVTAPVITCPIAVTRQCNTSTAPGATGTATATDNLDPNPVITFTDVNALGGCNGTGTITRTWRATDVAGNFSTCVQVITVIDNTNPVIITCPSNQVINTTLGVCTATATYAGAANDNCSTPTLTYSPASGSTFALGTTTVTMTATDGCGRTTTCAFTVTVQDNQAPNITCPAPLNLTCVTAVPAANTSLVTATDNCTSPITYSIGPVSGTTSAQNGNGASGGTANCDCPTGYVVVGYEGRAGGWFDNFRLRCRQVNPNGSLGATVTVTCNNGQSNGGGAVGPFELPAGQAMVGFNVRAGDWYDYLRGFGQSIASIGSGVANNIGASAAAGMGNVFGGTDRGTVYSPNGFVIVGMQTRPSTFYPSGTAWRYAPVLVSNAGPTVAFVADNGNGGAGCAGNPLIINRVYRATDASGNSSTCTQAITVIDNVNPTITVCPANRTVTAATNLCAATNTYSATATDNCGVPTVTFSPASGSSFPVGTSTVTTTATDACGNTATCAFTVTVTDNQAPVITCPANITAIATSANGAIVNYTAPTGTDNCPGATTTQIGGLGSGATFPIGVTTNIFRVTDAAGNSTTCSFTVTISGLAPVIVCPANITVNNAPGVCGNNVTFAATETTGIPASTITYSHAPGSLFPVGTTTVTATATNPVGTSVCTFTVTVIDNQIPAITCPANVSLCTDNFCQATLPNFVQNLGTTLLANSQADFFGGQGYRNWFYGEYSAFSSNSFTALPTWTGFVWQAGQAFNTPYLSATGGHPGVNNLSWAVRRWVSSYTGNVNLRLRFYDTNTSCGDGANIRVFNGTSQVWDYQNIPGNMQQFDIPVSVVCGDRLDFIIDPKFDGGCDDAFFTVEITTTNTASANDNCGIATVTQSPIALNGTPVGVTPVTLTATDVNGNSNTCSFNVTVTDQQAPNAICQPVTVQLNSAGNGTLTAAQVNNGSNDACGILNLHIGQAGFSCANVGANTVVLTVTDVNNNTSTCSATVTVQDLVAPIALCQPVTVQLNSAGNGTLNASQVNNGSNDACGILNLHIGQAGFTCANVGANTVVLTVTDVNNNTATCSATVTVQDLVAPNALCQNLTVSLDANGAASITPTQVNNGSTDACGIATYSLNSSTFACNNQGNNTTILSVTDINGNTSTCTSTIFVQDVTPPTALCQNVTIQLNAQGNGSVTATQVNNGSFDNCAVASLSVTPNTFTCANVGPNTVTLTVTDNSTTGSTINNANLIGHWTFEPGVESVDLTGNWTNLQTFGGATISGGYLDVTGGAQFAKAPAYAGPAITNKTLISWVSLDNINMFTGSALTIDRIATDNFDGIIYGEQQAYRWMNGSSGFSRTQAPVPGFAETVPNQQVMMAITYQDLGGGNVQIKLYRNGVLIGDYLDNPLGSWSAGDAEVWFGKRHGSGISGPGQLDAKIHEARIYGRVLSQSELQGLVTTYNTSTCTATITVQDNIAPVAICQNLTINLGSSGSQTVLASSINNGSNDACGIATTTLNPNTFTCDDLGVNNVTLTVTDVNANSSTCAATVTVTNDPLVATTASPTVACGYNVTCNGATNGSATVATTGGCLPYTYLWSNGQTTATANGLGAGTYTVTVTDLNGNTTTSTLTLTQPVLLTSATTSPVYQGGWNVTCNGANDGSIDLTVGGGASCLSYTFNWSNGATTEDLSNIGAGTYTVTVTDANGCSSTSSITLTAPNSLSNTLIPQVYQGGWNISCNGATDGMLFANVSGGTPAFSYAWSNGATTQMVTGLGAGTYTVTVTDQNGCFLVNSITLTEPPLMTDAISAVVRNCGFNVSCFGENDGSIDYTVNGGTAPYSYTWSNGATTEDISGLTAGTYSVTATDRNGCFTTETIVLTEPALLTANISLGTYACGYNVSCNGASNGSATVNTTGGCAPYTYTWSTLGVSASINGLPAIAVAVTVTDANGCQAYATGELIEPALLESSGVPSTYACGTNVSCNGASDGSINLSVIGGASCLAYTYIWSNGATTEDVSGLTAGNYSVTITDANGCSTSSSFTLTEPALLVSSA